MFEKKQKSDVKILSEDSGKSKSIFMDMYAYYTRLYTDKFGLTQDHFVKLSVKSHKNGAMNPHAMYQKEMSAEEILASGEVAYPLTRAMCSPVCDGSAAVVVCSRDKVGQFTTKPIWIEGSVVGSGKISDEIGDTLTKRLGPRLYESSGLGPGDIDTIEVHDATTPSEIITLIELGIVKGEEAAAWIEDGSFEIGGKMPSNTSGGLVTKGHPIGATGLAQVHEIVTQLRGEAGNRQVKDPKVGMTHNGGGILGVDAAAMALHMFKK